MSKMETFLNDKLIPVLDRISGYRWLRALRDGLIVISSITIVAAIFVVVAYIPFEWWQNFIAPMQSLIAIPGDIGMGSISLVVAFTMAISFAKYYELDIATNSAMSVYAFLLCNIKEGALSTDYFGAKGMFLAIAVAVFTTFVNYQFRKHGWTIKMPDGVPEVIAEVFQALLAGFVL